MNKPPNIYPLQANFEQSIPWKIFYEALQNGGITFEILEPGRYLLSTMDTPHTNGVQVVLTPDD